MQEKKSKFLKTGNNTDVLIPVDFSDKCNLAIQVGFELALRLKKEITIIHASVIANPSLFPQFPDDFNGMDNENTEIEEMELGEEMNEIDHQSLNSLKKKIKLWQTEKKIPDIPYKSVLAPGMPEEVLSEYCATSHPAVIVMSTRGMQKRKEEMVGSVTAEIIDRCIAPVLSIPENYSFPGFKEIVNICAFCYFDEGDFFAISKLMEMFNNPSILVYLYPAVESPKNLQTQNSLTTLKSRLDEAYPSSKFIVKEASGEKNIIKGAKEFFEEKGIQMILTPNKRRNIFSRLFNPGLPHKILYEIDFPMLVIPQEKS